MEHTKYIKGIREELLNIENNASKIDGLTESQWVAIRAAHRLLGEYEETVEALKEKYKNLKKDYYDAKRELEKKN